MSVRSHRALALALQILIPLVILLTWQIWSEREANFFFPSLYEIAQAFADNWLFARLGSDIAPSFARLLVGYSLAIVLGVAAGIPLGLVPLAYRTVAPVIEFVRAIPAVAIIPFGILLIGIDNGMKVFIIVFGCVWPILLNVIDGIRGVKQTLRDTARVYGLTAWQRLRWVILPAASPQIFAGLRTSLSLAIILMVISEMVASTNGIGFFVIQSQRMFAISDMWSGIVLLGLIGYGLNVVFLMIEARILRWHRSSRANHAA